MSRKLEFPVMVGVRLAPEVAERVAEQAKQAGITASERMRQLVTIGLTVNENSLTGVVQPLTVSDKDEKREVEGLTVNEKVASGRPRKAAATERRTREQADAHNTRLRKVVADEAVAALGGGHVHAPPASTPRSNGTRARCEGCGVPLERSNGMWLP